VRQKNNLNEGGIAMKKMLSVVMLVIFCLCICSKVMASGGDIWPRKIYNLPSGDYVAAGTGLYPEATGTISIKGIPQAQIVSAFLYWGYATTTDVNPDETTLHLIGFNGNIITGDLIGEGDKSCFYNYNIGKGYDKTYAYRADVWGYVEGNGNYLIDDVLKSNHILPLGASLVVVYVEGASKKDFNPRYIEIWEGLATLNTAVRKDYTIDGFATAQNSTGDTTFIVGGGIINDQTDWFWDEVTVEFSTGVPFYEEDAFRGLDGQYWDTRTYPRLLNEDENALLRVAIDVGINYPDGGDCLMWVAQIVSVETLCKNVVDSTDITTYGKGQSPTNNEIIKHVFWGKIVGIPDLNATKIYVCEGSDLTIDIYHNPVGPFPEPVFDLDPFTPSPFCINSPEFGKRSCYIDDFQDEITYSVTSSNGKDKDRITLIPVR